MIPTNPERFKQARERAGLSLGQVSVMLNLSRPWVVGLEAGNTSVEREVLDMLAKIYGVSQRWLSGEDIPVTIPPEYYDGTLTQSEFDLLVSFLERGVYEEDWLNAT